MIARILISLLAVPAFGYIAVCFGDPTAGFCRFIPHSRFCLCLPAHTANEQKLVYLCIGSWQGNDRT